MNNKKDLVLKLKELTLCSISDCLDALKQCDFDIEKALQVLQQKKGENVKFKPLGSKRYSVVCVHIEEQSVSVLSIIADNDIVLRSKFLWSEICEHLAFTENIDVLQLTKNLQAILKEELLIQNVKILKDANFKYGYHYQGVMNKLDGSAHTIVMCKDFCFVETTNLGHHINGDLLNTVAANFYCNGFSLIQDGVVEVNVPDLLKEDVIYKNIGNNAVLPTHIDNMQSLLDFCGLKNIKVKLFS